jgi:hypothetical protein
MTAPQKLSWAQLEVKNQGQISRVNQMHVRSSIKAERCSLNTSTSKDSARCLRRVCIASSAFLLSLACNRQSEVTIRPKNVPQDAIFVTGIKSIGWWQHCTVANAGQPVYCRIWNKSGLILENEEFQPYDRGAPPTADELKIEPNPTFQGPDRIFLINRRILLPRSRFDRLKAFFDSLPSHGMP